MTKMMKTTKTRTSKRAGRVRLTVACGDDLLRFFELPLRTAKAAKAEEVQKAITQAAAAFSQTFSAELKSQQRLESLRIR
jgi:hypothetical protein